MINHRDRPAGGANFSDRDLGSVPLPSLRGLS